MSSGSLTALFKLIGILSVGPFFAQFLMLLVSPWLTRLYSPSDFATVSVFLLFGAGMAALVCAKLDNAIIRCRDNEYAARLAVLTAKLVFLISFGLSLFSLALLYFFQVWQYLNFAVLLLFYLVMGGLYDILNALALQSNKAILVTNGRIFLVVVAIIFQILAGYSGCGAEGFVAGLVAGYFATTVYLYLHLRVCLSLTASKPSLTLSNTFHNHRDDFLFGTVATLFSTLQNNLPGVAVTVFVGPLAGGFYTLIQRVVFNPALTLASILSQSILPWLAQSHTGKTTAQPLVSLTALIFISMLGSILLIQPFCEQIFTFVFGESWRGAGAVAGILFLQLPFKLAYELVSVIMISESRQKLLSLSRLMTLLAGIIAIASVENHSTGTVFFVFSLVQSLSFTVALFFFFYAISMPFRQGGLIIWAGVALPAAYLALGWPNFGEPLTGAWNLKGVVSWLAIPLLLISFVKTRKLLKSAE